VVALVRQDKWTERGMNYEVLVIFIQPPFFWNSEEITAASQKAGIFKVPEIQLLIR